LAGIVYFVFLANFLGGAPGKTDNRAITGNTDGQTAATSEGEENKNVQKIVVDVNDLETTLVPPPIAKQDPVQVKKDDLKRLAASFAERFGSYSNQSNFGNITDLKIFMSRRMQGWADDYINARRGDGSANDLYYGITTKAVAQEVKDMDDDTGQASILVQTRRREATGSILNTSNVFDQGVLVSLIRENGSWKVDSAVWQ